MGYMVRVDHAVQRDLNAKAQRAYRTYIVGRRYVRRMAVVIGYAAMIYLSAVVIASVFGGGA